MRERDRVEKEGDTGGTGKDRQLWLSWRKGPEQVPSRVEKEGGHRGYRKRQSSMAYMEKGT